MKTSNTRRDNSVGVRQWIFLIASFLLSALVLYLTRYFEFPSIPLFWKTTYLVLFVVTLLIYSRYRSLGLVVDIFVIIAFMWWIYRGVGYASRPYVFLPLVVSLWLAVSYTFKGKFSFLLAWCAPALWFILSQPTVVSPSHTSHYLVLTTSLLMVSVFTFTILNQSKSPLKKIDFIISSYSGNTAHFANLFKEGIQQAGAEVVEHRFHHFKSFNAALHGDALVIAFPVYGCKPPWPFLYYLVFKLPTGRGKSAAILYTCIGGAENAGILCWLILTIKGYRVISRNMSVYPVNIPTFRLGSRRLWKFLDKLFPRQGDINFQRESGRKFANGKRSGIPFIFGLTPAFIFGILLDNKLFDTFLYRNHVMKKRCNQCNICIDYCPAERLKLVNNYPKAKGTCMICMGCVNICPTNAMHLWCWTEYGNQYKPKYRKFVVKKKLTEEKT